MVKVAYEKLKKKYPALPVFKDIDRHFELSRIETDVFLLREIKKKIREKIEPIIDILERILNPDPNHFTDLYENHCFTSAERKQVLDIFKHLMEQYRALIETDILADDKADVGIIKTTYDLWLQEKDQIVPIIRKLRECWQKHVEPRKILEYLG